VQRRSTLGVSMLNPGRRDELISGATADAFERAREQATSNARSYLLSAAAIKNSVTTKSRRTMRMDMTPFDIIKNAAIIGSLVQCCLGRGTSHYECGGAHSKCELPIRTKTGAVHFLMLTQQLGKATRSAKQVSGQVVSDSAHRARHTASYCDAYGLINLLSARHGSDCLPRCLPGLLSVN